MLIIVSLFVFVLIIVIDIVMDCLYNIEGDEDIAQDGLQDTSW